MSKSYTQTRPEWEAKALFGAAILLVAATDAGSVIYAFQTASKAQILWGVPTDAVLKAAGSIGAAIGVAVGARVAAWLFGAGLKTYRLQAWLLAIATLACFCVSAGNVSGYNARTRAEAEREAIISGPLYQAAAAKVLGGEGYISDAERRLVASAEPTALVERDAGDIFKAMLMLAIAMALAVASKLPARAKGAKRASGRASGRARGKSRKPAAKADQPIDLATRRAG